MRELSKRQVKRLPGLRLWRHTSCGNRQLSLGRRRHRSLQIADTFAQYLNLLLERFAIDADSFEDLRARGLDCLGRFSHVVEVAGAFFDFENGFVDRLEIHLLSGRLPFGAEAESASGNDASLQEHVS